MSVSLAEGNSVRRKRPIATVADPLRAFYRSLNVNTALYRSRHPLQY
jgi:hypothetical protein